ncbi:MAG TPA: hypothetical protein VFK47_03500, partial [Ktedonobacteraceae bacterium]|nr:hypothetical protein [Ktedonobacteraceae bacterium]
TDEMLKQYGNGQTAGAGASTANTTTTQTTGGTTNVNTLPDHLNTTNGGPKIHSGESINQFYHDLGIPDALQADFQTRYGDQLVSNNIAYWVDSKHTELGLNMPRTDANGEAHFHNHQAFLNHLNDEYTKELDKLKADAKQHGN